MTKHEKSKTQMLVEVTILSQDKRTKEISVFLATYFKNPK